MLIYGHRLTGTAYCGLYMAVFSTKIPNLEGGQREKKRKYLQLGLVVRGSGRLEGDRGGGNGGGGARRCWWW